VTVQRFGNTAHHIEVVREPRQRACRMVRDADIRSLLPGVADDDPTVAVCAKLGLGQRFIFSGQTIAMCREEEEAAGADDPRELGEPLPLPLLGEMREDRHCVHNIERGVGIERRRLRIVDAVDAGEVPLTPCDELRANICPVYRSPPVPARAAAAATEIQHLHRWIVEIESSLDRSRTQGRGRGATRLNERLGVGRSAHERTKPRRRKFAVCLATRCPNIPPASTSVRQRPEHTDPFRRALHRRPLPRRETHDQPSGVLMPTVSASSNQATIAKNETRPNAANK
jgi:hypothetical protein